MSDLDAMVADVRTHAAALYNAWDRRAIDWPLDETSVVVEVGGYTGRWALQMAERYAPRLYVFEPQGWAAEVCATVLRPYVASVLPWGLGVRDERLPMGGWGSDGCSFLKPSDGEVVKVVEASSVLPPHIDLMMMNIEGYEYTLIPHMLKQGILPDRLIVQFHPQPEGDETMAIYGLLDAHGYHIAWDYGVVLAAWERR